MFLDLLWLSPQRLPETWRLLVLHDGCDLCLSFTLILIDLFCKQPERWKKQRARNTDLNHYIYQPESATSSFSTSGRKSLCKLLPGLCGAAQGGVASPPDKDFQPCVQQEDVTTRERKTGCYGPHLTLNETQCTCPPHSRNKSTSGPKYRQWWCQTEKGEMENSRKLRAWWCVGVTEGRGRRPS